MGRERFEQAQQKRRLAALIRQYGTWLDDLDKRDLLAYAASIEAEADRLERGDIGTDAPAPAPRKPSPS